MSDNQNESKLRLRNTDTNRFKVDTGRLKVQRPQDAAEGVQDTLRTQKVSELHDALSLRDTSTGRLRKVETAEAQAAGMGEKRSETVRLKVIRHQPRIPGVSADSEPTTVAAAPAPVAPPTPVAPPPPVAAPTPVAEPAASATETVSLSDATEQKKSMTVRLKVKKPGETAAASATTPVPAPAPTPAPAPVAETTPVAPAEPISQPAAEAVPPLAAAAETTLPAAEQKKSMTVRLKVQKPAEPAADKTTEVPPPTATSTAAEPLRTSTIKLNPLKPKAETPEETTATKTSTIKLNPIKPAAPAKEAAPLSSATANSGKPEAVKLRPAPGASAPTGETPAPASNASETIKLQPNVAPGSSPAPRKLSLKKEAEPAPAPAPEAESSNAAATVVVPQPEQSGKPSLKLPGSKLKKLPADGAPQAPDAQAVPVAPPPSFNVSDDDEIGTVPSICAIVGTVAALVVISTLVMAMLQIM